MTGYGSEMTDRFLFLSSYTFQYQQTMQIHVRSFFSISHLYRICVLLRSGAPFAFMKEIEHQELYFLQRHRDLSLLPKGARVSQ